MGNFSYMCKECGLSIRQDEDCVGLILNKGEIVERKSGIYDGYGFSDNWNFKDWNSLVDMHFNKDKSTGFAFYHQRCYKGQKPRTVSNDDPNQGWGKPRKKFMG